MATIGNQRAKQYEEEVQKAYAAGDERDMWKEKYYKMLELYEECMASYSAAVDELKNA